MNLPIIKHILHILPWPGGLGVSVEEITGMLGTKRVWTSLVLGTLKDRRLIETYRIENTTYFCLTHLGMRYYLNPNPERIIINPKARLNS